MSWWPAPFAQATPSRSCPTSTDSTRHGLWLPWLFDHSRQDLLGLTKIGAMEAFVAILVALIAAAAGFAGGYLGSRWQAETNRAQWRRDQLLQFCADLLAAGGEVVDVANALKRGEKQDWPTDALRRVSHAYECISLLSRELSSLANNYRSAVLAHLAAAPKGGKVGELTKEDADVVDAFALFTASAHVVLLDLRTQPTRWHDLRRQIASLWAKGKGIAKTQMRPPPTTAQGPVSPPPTAAPTDTPGGTTSQP